MRPEEADASIAALRARVVDRVRELGGDEVLAEDVAHFIALAARGRLVEVASDPGVWERLEDFGVALAVHRLRKQRRRVSPELVEVIAGAHGDEVAEADVLVALKAVPARERALLEMVYVDGYDLDAAAEFFDLDRRGVQRLLGRARRRLRREYRAQFGTPPVAVVLLDAGRRLRGALVRAPGQWAESVLGWGLDPMRAVVATTAGMSVAVVAAVMVGGGPHHTPETRSGGTVEPVAVAREEGTTAAVLPTSMTEVGGAAATGPARSAAVPGAAPLLIERRVDRGPTGTRTSYRAENPTPPPSPPVGPAPELRQVVVFDCPPPRARSVTESLVCPIIEGS